MRSIALYRGLELNRPAPIQGASFVKTLGYRRIKRWVRALEVNPERICAVMQSAGWAFCYYSRSGNVITVKIFDLLCANDHRFEGWFASGAEYEQQRDSGIIACPMCGDSQIVKVPAASYVNTGATDRAPVPKAEVAEASPEQTQYANFRSAMLAKLVEYVVKNTEDVGKDFPEEARKIHYGETPDRKIRGVASAQEVFG